MKTITIYGCSDDLIEVEGAIREEFTAHEDGEPEYLAFSDGTVLSIAYTQGLWRIHRITLGSADLQKEECLPDDEDNYTDRVTLTGDIKWCVCGPNFQRAK